MQENRATTYIETKIPTFETGIMATVFTFNKNVDTSDFHPGTEIEV
jgi:hypothetical protein